MPYSTHFETKTRQDWLNQIGQPLDASRTLPGFEWLAPAELQPIYEAASIGPSLNTAHPASTPWLIAQRIDHPDPKKANEQSIADLSAGAAQLALVFDGAPSARGFGTPPKAAALAKCLRKIVLDAASIRLEPHPRGGQLAEWLAEIVQDQKFDPKDCAISFGIDPIASLARWGQSEIGALSGWDLARLIKTLTKAGFSGPFLELDGRPYAEAGADPSQELGAVLAVSLYYLKELERANLDPSAVSQWFGTTLTATQNQTLTIAKFRAWRLLWEHLLASCDIEPEPNRLHAETAVQMMMRREPHTNLLRTTIAAFAAGAAGADSMTVLPFSAALGLPDSFARRMARNTQLLLIEEAQIDKVADSAAGSGAYDWLTDQMAATAWEHFQQIEREGGIVESLVAGQLQARIAKQRSMLMRDLVDGDLSLVGVTTFQGDESDLGTEQPLSEATEPVFAEPDTTCQKLEPLDLEQYFFEAQAIIANDGDPS